MPGRGVRVLSDDKHPYVGERALEGTQHGTARRKVAPTGRGFRAQEFAKLRDAARYGLKRDGPVGGDELGERLRHDQADSASVGNSTGGSADHGNVIQSGVRRHVYVGS